MTTNEIKKLNLLYDCYIIKCNNEFRKRKEKKDIWYAMTNKIINDYNNGSIKSRKEFITKINKLDNDYFNSIENVSMHNCEIDKCYNLVKQYLDYLYSKYDYKKKDNYSAEDYINILKINKNINKK